MIKFSKAAECDHHESGDRSNGKPERIKVFGSRCLLEKASWEVKSSCVFQSIQLNALMHRGGFEAVTLGLANVADASDQKRWAAFFFLRLFLLHVNITLICLKPRQFYSTSLCKYLNTIKTDNHLPKTSSWDSGSVVPGVSWGALGSGDGAWNGKIKTRWWGSEMPWQPSEDDYNRGSKKTNSDL